MQHNSVSPNGPGQTDSERSALFSALAERLARGEADTDPERREYLLRLLSGLMPQVDRQVRRAAAESIAQTAQPPMDLALVLARDEPSVAAPVLRQAPFSPQELIELVMRTGPEAHIEIAKRADLTLDVWLALARAATRRAGAPAAQPQAPKAPPPPEREEVRAEPEPDWRSLPPEAAEPGPGAEDWSLAAAPPWDERPAEAEEERRAETVQARPPKTAATPLADSNDHSWRFETDRTGRLTRLSANAAQAFGDVAPSLVGEPFAYVLAAHAAAPAPDEVGEAMARHVPVRDIIVETFAADAGPKRWRLRAQPRFTFPEGRFAGYSGVAEDIDAARQRSESPKPAAAGDPAELLDRLARAADRLAQAADTPELADYARAMKEYAEALRSAGLAPGAAGAPAERRR